MKKYQIVIWLGAMALGVVLGLLGIGWLDKTMNVIAMVYTRLFRLLAVASIVLAVISTLSTLVSGWDCLRIF